jgi:hypothetical protein
MVAAYAPVVLIATVVPLEVDEPDAHVRVVDVFVSAIRF